MDEARLDALLARALTEGRVPADASPDEAEALRRYLGAAGLLTEARADVTAEAEASMPVARARFERFVASRRERAAVAAKPPRRGSTSLFVRRPLWLSAAASLVVLAVGAAFAARALFSGADTASAQVLEPGDYVQFQGVVSQAPADTSSSLTVATDFDEGVEVTLEDTTSILEGESPAAPAALAVGAPVAITGEVDEGGRVVARSVAFVREVRPAPDQAPIERLKHLAHDLNGTIVHFVLNAEGSAGKVVIVTAEGHRLLVEVDGVAAERLFRLVRVLGTEVTLTPSKDGAPSLDLRPATPGDGPPSATPGAPTLSSLEGVITGRTFNVLEVETARGPVKVVLTRRTRIVLGESGLLREAFLRGEASAIGHTVVISGNVDKDTRRIVADVLSIGPDAE
jgi:hypothetical protein